ncbi:c-type cytochrome [Paenibacillus sp. 1001270B_150601_E10]|uniref:c-type cytochrome n=1 Tax=Paenibacillus sp. 1001270B_150601_E10 TaxID=2787079 RepID=UPI0018A057C9|nr:cytochrome c [Paenibacillus sp. 1001270B_150601_E10]
MRSLLGSKGLGVFIGALCLGAVLAGCSSSNGASSNAESNAILSEAPAEAANVYKQSCLQCHGGNLEGRMGKDTNLQKVGDRLTKEEIIDKIHNGGTRMPQVGRSMEEGDVEKVAEWLSTLKSDTADKPGA